MVKLNNTFEFVGNLKFMKEPVKETEFDSGWTKKELKVMVNENKANGVFLTVEGGYWASKGSPDKVFSFTKGLHGEKGSKLEVSWEDRKDASILDTVADFSKKVVDLTVDTEAKEKYYELRKAIRKLEVLEEPSNEDKVKLTELRKEVKEAVPHRYEFIHELDVVDFFEKFSEKLNGKKFKVRGDVKMSYWNGKFYTSYSPNVFELVEDETPNKLALDLDLYFTKDVADKTLFKTDKIVTYNTYILARDSQHKKDVFFPFTTVLNASNYDLENPSHKGHIEIVEKYFMVKGKGVYHLPYSAKVISGAETVDFSEKDLTPDQKLLIDIGMAQLKDFKPKGQVFGDTLNEVRLLFPKIRDLGEGANFTNGALETDYAVDELDYTPVERGAKVEDVKVEKEKVDSNPFDIDPNSLPF